jgi:mRNA interferase MazF
LQNHSGKPRPALINAPLTAVVLPATSTLPPVRHTRIDIITVETKCLRGHSQIAIDRPRPVRREKIGQVISRADHTTMLVVNRALTVFLGLA